MGAVVLLQLDSRVFAELLRYLLATSEPLKQPCDVRIGRLLDVECMRDGDDAVEHYSWVVAVSLVWLACVLKEETRQRVRDNVLHPGDELDLEVKLADLDEPARQATRWFRVIA